MPVGGGPFYVLDLAQALARLPNRLECDRDESHRIGRDMFEWFQRGKFKKEEVVARYGDPPRFTPIAEVVADARGQGRPSEIDPNLWYAAVALTYSAAKRYVEHCGLCGARRVLDEWFSSDAPNRGHEPASQQGTQRAAYEKRVAEFRTQGRNPPLQTTKGGVQGDREWAAANSVSRSAIAAWRRELLGYQSAGRPRKNSA